MFHCVEEPVDETDGRVVLRPDVPALWEYQVMRVTSMSRLGNFVR